MGSGESAAAMQPIFTRTTLTDLKPRTSRTSTPQHRVRITKALYLGGVPCHGGPVPAVFKRRGLQGRMRKGTVRVAGATTASRLIRSRSKPGAPRALRRRTNTRW